MISRCSSIINYGIYFQYVIIINERDWYWQVWPCQKMTQQAVLSFASLSSFIDYALYILYDSTSWTLEIGTHNILSMKVTLYFLGCYPPSCFIKFPNLSFRGPWPPALMSPRLTSEPFLGVVLMSLIFDELPIFGVLLFE